MRTSIKLFSLPLRRSGKTVYKVTISVQKKQEIVDLETNINFYIYSTSLMVYMCGMKYCRL